MNAVTSEIGTYRTEDVRLTMSVHRSEADIAVARTEVRK